MNQLSHIIRRFNRFELKYLIPLSQAEVFKTALKAYLTEDKHGNGSGHYRLASLYYDSPDYRCYWEKVDGVKFRRKLRIRQYQSDLPLTMDTPVFVEIKQRLDRATQKRRVILPYETAMMLCNQRQIPESSVEDQPVIHEIYAFLWQYNLRPVSIVRYNRQAFIGSDYDIGLRVTFDTDLTYQVDPISLHQPENSQPLLPADYAVMEIKVNERIPYWLTELVAVHNLQLVRMSKYCRSIESANHFSFQQSFMLSNVI